MTMLSHLEPAYVPTTLQRLYIVQDVRHNVTVSDPSLPQLSFLQWWGSPHVGCLTSYDEKANSHPQPPTRKVAACAFIFVSHLIQDPLVNLFLVSLIQAHLFFFYIGTFTQSRPQRTYH